MAGTVCPGETISRPSLALRRPFDVVSVARVRVWQQRAAQTVSGPRGCRASPPGVRRRHTALQALLASELTTTVLPMDRTWMRERLEAFKTLYDDYDRLRASPGITARDIRDTLTTDLPTVRAILNVLDPALTPLTAELFTNQGRVRVRQAINEALGVVRDQELWKAMLSPDAPSLVADQFHPHVWEAAAAIWDTGKYRVAVQQAAVSLSTHIATKAGSPLTERKLVQEVFKTDPPTAAQARLHFPGDNSTETWRSRQQGLHLVAQGAFAGIRNVATHTNDEWSEQVALEHLAVLSVVARWTDETERATI